MTTSDSHRVSRSRPAVRLTRRGRAILVLVIVGAILLAFWLGTWRAGIAATDPAARATAYDTVVLEPGDTLWDIAERRAPDADPRLLVYRMIELNDLSGVAVEAGQRIRVPHAD